MIILKDLEILKDSSLQWRIAFTSSSKKIITSPVELDNNYIKNIKVEVPTLDSDTTFFYDTMSTYSNYISLWSCFYGKLWLAVVPDNDDCKLDSVQFRKFRNKLNDLRCLRTNN